MKYIKIISKYMSRIFNIIMYVIFEGMNKCGKTTQLNLLADYLKTKTEYIFTRKEPGQTPLGKELREILLHKNLSISPLTQALLFYADRIENIKEIIYIIQCFQDQNYEDLSLYLDKYDIINCPGCEDVFDNDDYFILQDRCAISTIVYQSMGDSIINYYNLDVRLRKSFESIYKIEWPIADFLVYFTPLPEDLYISRFQDNYDNIEINERFNYYKISNAFNIAINAQQSVTFSDQKYKIAKEVIIVNSSLSKEEQHEYIKQKLGV